MRELAQLKRADREARAHEQAHRAVGGNLITGGPYYDYERGPDGQRYAVSGEVTIDTSEIRNDPDANADKMDQVRRTALAPRDPSSQDRQVASQAGSKASQSRAEAVRLSAEESRVEREAQSLEETNSLYAPPETEADTGLLVDSVI